VANYSEFIALAHELLEEFGEESTLVRSVGTPSDPEKPWAQGTPVVIRYPVHTAWITESILRRPTLVKQGEVFAILASEDLEVVPDPSVDQMERADGRRYAIVKVEPLNPAGQVIIYEVTARS
jgi:hypothetical protein